MYAFLPIFLAIIIWLGVIIYKHCRGLGKAVVLRQLRSSFGGVSLITKVATVSLAILMFGLFFERYGINILRYDTPTPECNQVLSIQQCSAYGPWERNYLTHQSKVRGQLAPVKSDPISYTFGSWLRIMSYQLFFSLNGQLSSFAVGAPLPLPETFAVVAGIIGLLLIIWYRKYLKKINRLNFLIFVSLVYLIFLWGQEYTDFVHLGLAVAIQARYLMPVLPIIYLVFGLAFARALRAKPYLKALLAWGAVALLLLEGGGAMVFILRSDPSWYWPNHYVITANATAQKILRHFVIGS
jgi:hypothetical protein